MGLLDGVLQFLEEKMFKRMEEQFKELIGILKDIDTKLDTLVKLQSKEA